MKKYDELKNTRIEIVSGYKGKNSLIEIRFDDTRFAHLVGINKLTDTQYGVKSFTSRRFCEEVRKGNIAQSDLEKSQYFFKGHFDEDDPPFKRFEIVFNLIDLLSNNKVDYYKISHGKVRNIKADYQIKINCSNCVRFFVIYDDKVKYYVPVTVIQSNLNAYNCESKTLLFLALYDLKNSRRNEIFRHKNFQPTFDERDRLKL